MVVGQEVHLLVGAVRAEDHLLVVDDPPVIGFGLCPAQRTGRRQRKDADALRGHSIDIPVRPNVRP